MRLRIRAYTERDRVWKRAHAPPEAASPRLRSRQAADPAETTVRAPVRKPAGLSATAELTFRRPSSKQSGVRRPLYADLSVLFTPSTDYMRPTHGGAVCSTLLIHTLLLSRNTLTDEPGVMSGQCPGAHGPVESTHKITHHTSRKI